MVHRPRQSRRARAGQRARERGPVPRDRDRLPEGVPVARRSTRRRSAAPTRTRRSAASATRRSSRRCWPARVPSRRTRTAASSRRPSTRRRSANSHGYGQVEAAERRASDGNATYYSFRPRAGVELISLDTVAEGGGSTGNLDHPQYRWLERKLKAAKQADRLVIAYGHHTLATLSNSRSDEDAGSCAPTPKPGCDADPRRSTPIHRGTTGANSVRDLFLRYPNVVAYVAGHTHDNRIDLFKQGPDGLLADQHRLARRHAAAEPPDRADGQPRRHAVAVHDGARPRRADRGARPGHGGGGLHGHPARERVARAGVERPAARARARSAARWTATWSCCCATRVSTT